MLTKRAFTGGAYPLEPWLAVMRNIPGYKMEKNRMTVLVCANAAGTHRLTPLVIGKAQRPLALRGVKMIPVHYRVNKTTWKTRDIHQEWNDKRATPEIKQHLRDNTKNFLINLKLSF